MSEPPDTTAAGADSPAGTKNTAVKDRNCSYCGQAFTSSSLGRHLDLYIKDKNPKPPDGIHDVEAIRKMRGAITRRQPRGSLFQRDVSNPGTPQHTSTRKSPSADSVIKPPAIPREGQYVVDNQPSRHLFQLPWTATGVINDIPVSNGAVGGGGGSPWDGATATHSADAASSTTREQIARIQNPQRVPSRAAQKVQLDARQKLADAMDTARAAELALRELLSSMRAAKHHIDMNSLPFDFDPLSLDFPALTLQCLQAPPTLFSSTPHPTSTSWSIEPPSQKQYEALQTYFENEFSKWRVRCAVATTTAAEDLTYPPNEAHVHRDIHEGIRKAERNADFLEKQVKEHLHSTYGVWEQLNAQRRGELWVLELARSNGRRQQEFKRLTEAHHTVKQENANLKLQIEQLNTLQQPREFRTMTPATIPIDEAMLVYMQGLGVKGSQSVGYSLEYRHVDINTMVASAIERWKNVIIATKGPGLGVQRSLDQVTPTDTPASLTPVTLPPLQLHRNPVAKRQPKQKADVTPLPVSAASPPTTAAPPAANEDQSEGDADADADADPDADMVGGTHFTPIPAAATRPSRQSHAQLEVPRTRGHHPRASSARFANGNSVKAREPTSRRSMPKLNAGPSAAVHGQAQRGQAEEQKHKPGSSPEAADDDPMSMD